MQPFRIALHTNLGSVTFRQFALAVMLGVDNTIILGNRTFERLGLDIDEKLMKCGWHRIESITTFTMASVLCSS